MPKVGVLLPVYNGDKYISEALQSVLIQSFGDFHVYVVDDGSTDRTAEIISSFTDPRIKYIRKEKNSGVTDSLNCGLQEIREEYIIRMDSDDVSEPNRFETLVEYMDRNQDVIVCGSQVEYFGQYAGTSSFSLSEADLKADLIFGSGFVHPSVIIRNRLLLEHGLKYPLGYLHHEDFAFWRLLANYGKFQNLPNVLLRYRMDGQNISVGNFETKARRLHRIYTEIFQEIKIECEEKNYLLHLELSGIKPTTGMRKLVNYAKYLRKQLKQYSSLDPNAVDALVTRRFNLLFFKESDASRLFAPSYWWSLKKIKWIELRYYLATFLKSRKA